jgi:hypothetical protein
MALRIPAAGLSGGVGTRSASDRVVSSSAATPFNGF